MTVAVLERDGTDYVSAAKVENEGPCLDDAGDRIPGGAKVSSTMRLWRRTSASPARRSRRPRLIGSLTLGPRYQRRSARPRVAARSRPRTSSAAARRAVAGRDEPLPEPDQPPNTAGGVVEPAVDRRQGPGRQDRLLRRSRATPSTSWHASLARAAFSRAAPSTTNGMRATLGRPPAPSPASTISRTPIDQRTTSDRRVHDREADVRPRSPSTCRAGSAPKKVPKRLLAWWRDIVTFIRDHEAGHVDITLDHLKR